MTWPKKDVPTFIPNHSPTYSTSPLLRLPLPQHCHRRLHSQDRPARCSLPSAGQWSQANLPCSTPTRVSLWNWVSSSSQSHTSILYSCCIESFSLTSPLSPESASPSLSLADTAPTLVNSWFQSFRVLKLNNWIIWIICWWVNVKTIVQAPKTTLMLALICEWARSIGWTVHWICYPAAVV